MRVRGGVSVAALALALATSGCAREEPPRVARPAACNPLVRSEPARARDFVFILTDTTRRDRLGVYGGLAHTPNFDAFAAAGILFTAASTQAPWTKPSIATLFTGLPPAAHGLVSHPALRKDRGALESDVLGASHHTLAESLTAAGYQTAAFVSNPWLRRDLGFDQGFEVWDESFAANETPGEVVTNAGLEWLRERAGDDRPFFLYLHYMDAHSPYHPVPKRALDARRDEIAKDERPLAPQARVAIAKIARGPRGQPLAARGAAPNLALFELVYDQGVEHFDRALGSFLAGFRRLPGSAEAAVLVTSDHGEALLANGIHGHGHGLYEDEAAVPLAAQLPGVEATGPVSCPVGLIDLRKTLCEYLGVPCQGEADQGTSLFSAAVSDPERLVLTESVIDRPRNRAVRDARHKLLFEPDGRRAKRGGGPFELYDLEADPSERVDLLVEGRADAAARQAFERLRAEAERSAAGPRDTAERTELDEATRKRLEALGYLDPAD